MHENPVQKAFDEIESRNGWPVHYQKLEVISQNLSCNAARSPSNRSLNRYRNVSPYDHSRVFICTGPTDYINANYVKVPEANRTYILTQGPLPQTVGHFWLMVWEQQSRAIVMLNRVVEKNQIKCHKYWPSVGEASLLFDDVGITVTHVKEEDYKFYTLRTFSLGRQGEEGSQEVLQFHYTTWPDFGVPESPTTFLQFLEHVRQSGSLCSDVGPAVIHCSAGIGRSGTLCLVDSCLELVHLNGIDSVDVDQLLRKMRTFRMGLIQTPDQLRFSYLAIIQGCEALHKGLSISSGSPAVKMRPRARELGRDMEDEENPPPPPPRVDSLEQPISDGNILLNGNSLPTRDTSGSDDLMNIRKREREKRREKTSQLVTDIRKKQKLTEEKAAMKRLLFHPYLLTVGGVILGLASIYALQSWSARV
ncbi:unnamed protein product [Darwinula stevensoni]|uniref:protein-tyrosine-phosphatase n=1 Tax=Darwinula stevensoni TaxID=69355 RepID=A0A7R9A216_9CRUS|nr:unnamed protein product [Darwinula stevensoni]CAG0878942.1 unnamed protein product [Darwinula stevensoni]